MKTNKELVDDLEDLKKKDKSSFEIHRILVEKFNKIDYVKKQYKELNKSEDVNKMFYDINDIDESLNAYIKFYNENITKYNELVKKFPYLLMATILKYKEKPYFDNKDLTDDVVNDFKL
ncbi:MAG: LemA family protein [Bacilli bacterium]|nr:LemA family protein [Bacilli bacterium]